MEEEEEVGEHTLETVLVCDSECDTLEFRLDPLPIVSSHAVGQWCIALVFASFEVREYAVDEDAGNYARITCDALQTETLIQTSHVNAFASTIACLPCSYRRGQRIEFRPRSLSFYPLRSDVSWLSVGNGPFIRVVNKSGSVLTIVEEAREDIVFVVQFRFIQASLPRIMKLGVHLITSIRAERDTLFPDNDVHSFCATNELADICLNGDWEVALTRVIHPVFHRFLDLEIRVAVILANSAADAAAQHVYQLRLNPLRCSTTEALHKEIAGCINKSPFLRRKLKAGMVDRNGRQHLQFAIPASVKKWKFRITFNELLIKTFGLTLQAREFYISPQEKRVVLNNQYRLSRIMPSTIMLNLNIVQPRVIGGSYRDTLHLIPIRTLKTDLHRDDVLQYEPKHLIYVPIKKGFHPILSFSFKTLKDRDLPIAMWDDSQDCIVCLHFRRVRQIYMKE